MILAFIACSCAWAQVDDANTVTLLHFDGTTTDEAGRTWTAIGGAVATSAEAKFGAGSLFLDGSGDELLASYAADLDFGTGDFTVDWWEIRVGGFVPGGSVYNTDSAAAYPGLLAGYYNAGATGISIYGSTNNAGFDIADAKKLGTASTSWVHRALVRSGTDFYTFENGVQETTWTAAGALASPTTITIGGYTGTTYFSGYIDELRVSNVARWTSAFTPPTSEYAPTTVLGSDSHVYFAGARFNTSIDDDFTTTLMHFDESLYDGGGSIWTANGSAVATSTLAKFGSGSLISFGGSTHYLSSPDSDDWTFTDGDFTIDCWIYQTDAPGAAFPRVVSHASGTTAMVLYTNNAGGGGQLGFSDGTILLGMLATGALPLNTWVHAAIVRSGTDFMLFQNGQLTASASTALSLGDKPGLRTIGGRASDYSFPGYIDELRVSKGVARWTSNFTPPTSEYQEQRQNAMLLAPGGSISFRR